MCGVKCFARNQGRKQCYRGLLVDNRKDAVENRKRRIRILSRCRQHWNYCLENVNRIGSETASK